MLARLSDAKNEFSYETKRLRTDANSKTYLASFILAIASLLYLYGCTEKALQLARDKASPLNIEHRKIKSIISAVRLENEDIAVCVELNDSGEKAEPKLNTTIVPLYSDRQYELPLKLSRLCV